MAEYPSYLIHYGIPGQKWGVRRWQNEDGSLTPEGYEHYGKDKAKQIESKELYKQWKKSQGYNFGDNKLLKRKVSEDKKLMNLNKKADELGEKIYPKKIDLKQATEHDKFWADEMFFEQEGKGLYNRMSKYKQKKYKQIYEDLLSNEIRSRLITEAKNDGSLKKYYKLRDNIFKEENRLANELLGKYANKRVKFRGKHGRYTDRYDNTTMQLAISQIKYK